MNIKKYEKYSTDSFVNDENFWLWVLDNNKEQESFWRQVLELYPEKQREIAVAKQTVLEINEQQAQLQEAKVAALWHKITCKITNSGV